MRPQEQGHAASLDDTIGDTPVVPPEVQTPYDHALDHVGQCAECGALRDCPTGARLRQAAREAR
ncbi:hypothetical protein ACFRMN_26840 [Streptomyces sp. NPDC056835]|uniref:hypothetical protein n=1 Tax=Streptomyces sp. NPDC056835 TaxID=3345956 RepID=UPI0036885914